MYVFKYVDVYQKVEIIFIYSYVKYVHMYVRMLKIFVSFLFNIFDYFFTKYCDKYWKHFILFLIRWVLKLSCK